MKERGSIEVLAPAGSFESMRAAVNAGADAVYMGGTKFGARAYAKNPETDRLLEAIDYVHLHGKKLYLTVNTLLKERELSEELYEFLVPVYEAGVDALIVQDFGVWQMAREHFPDLPLHASTQMTITGVNGAKEARRQGAARIVTARELSVAEIRQIHEQVADVEIETFVHGALCYSYSGQCLFSSLAGGRSGNRGRCAQPCRLPYQVLEGKRHCSDRAETYLMNLKDLCGLDSLGELLDAGVHSLKIEGRMKSPRYTAGVVSIYRKYVDLYEKVGSGGWKAEREDKKFLLELFDRGGFSKGYFHTPNGRSMLVLSGKPPRQVDAALFEELEEIYVKPEKKEKIKGTIRIAQDLPVKLSFRMGAVSVCVEGAQTLPAKNRSLTEEEVRRQIEKLGETPFVLEKLDIRLSEGCFLPVSQLNELRRRAVTALTQEILARYKRKQLILEAEKENIPTKVFETEPCSEQDSEKKQVPLLSALVEEEAQFLASVREPSISRLYLSVDAMEPEQLLEFARVCKAEEKECFLALPRIWRSGADRSFLDESIRKQIDGFLIRVLDELPFLDEYAGTLPEESGKARNYEFVADASLYTFNRKARRGLASRGIAMDTAPFELNGKELRERGISGSEVVVYGRLPMMVSAQCIRKTMDACKKSANPSAKIRTGGGRAYLLKDRKGFCFPVKQSCRFCYNVIYNSAPLWLTGELPSIQAMGPRMLRLQFTTEKSLEVTAVIRAYEAAMREAEYDYQPENRTKGHLRRGVE
ncbi:MAG: U32 family peptidase [Lachnospiraceae bacterium]|nr:U32 family peptidase [Lachnospiraceae bacterium]